MEKEKMIEKVVEEFKKLEPSKKMYVLGFMQATLMNQEQAEKAKTA